MAWLISYVVTRGYMMRGPKILQRHENLYPIGHAAVALTEVHEGKPPKIIFRIGLFNTNRVILEDFIQNKENREFYHKTYPISSSELSELLKNINEERRVDKVIQGAVPAEKAHKSLAAQARALFKRKMSEVVKQGDKTLESTPGGPKFNWFTNNCKSNAQHLLHTIGIDDPAIKTILIDVPTLSELNKFEMRQTDKNGVMEWVGVPPISPRENLDTFEEGELMELNTLIDNHELQAKEGLVLSSAKEIKLR